MNLQSIIKDVSETIKQYTSGLNFQRIIRLLTMASKAAAQPYEIPSMILDEVQKKKLAERIDDLEKTSREAIQTAREAQQRLNEELQRLSDEPAIQEAMYTITAAIQGLQAYQAIAIRDQAFVQNYQIFERYCKDAIKAINESIEKMADISTIMYERMQETDARIAILEKHIETKEKTTTYETYSIINYLLMPKPAIEGKEPILLTHIQSTGQEFTSGTEPDTDEHAKRLAEILGMEGTISWPKICTTIDKYLGILFNIAHTQDEDYLSGHIVPYHMGFDDNDVNEQLALKLGLDDSKWDDIEKAAQDLVLMINNLLQAQEQINYLPHRPIRDLISEQMGSGATNIMWQNIINNVGQWYHFATMPRKYYL